MPSEFDPQKHHRRSIHLPGYDYTEAGAYYITIVRYQRALLSGQVVDGEIQFKIIVVVENRMAMNSSPSVGPRHASPLPFDGLKPHSLGAIVGSPKSAVRLRIGREFNTTGIWQRNYFEHIIRNERDLQNKTDYILANPSLWAQDDENPVRFA